MFNSPILLGLFLVILSFIGGLRVRVASSSWFFFLIVLVFTGGIIILSLYIFRFSSVFKITWRESVVILFIFIFMLLFQAREKIIFFQIQGLIDYERVEMIVFMLVYLLFTIRLVIDFVLKIKGSFQG